MEDNIAKIKDKLDVVDVVGSYIKLQKAGVNYKARCPFHNEKSGSFFVSPERQIWHCFGCGLGGDIFGFIKQIEGVEFADALRMLATRAGIELSSYKPSPEFQNAKTRLYEISELASKFFGKQLHESKAGETALQYLKDRGLNDDTVTTFKLGFAPETWSGLTNFLYSRGYTEKEIVSAGLAISRDSKGSYDRFRSRIMFPIFDIHGQTVGFTGRIFQGDSSKKESEEVAKYINTPQTAIYDKSGVLYGLNFARLDVRRKNRCLVVEGNMDVIMSHQAGAMHVVAASGTALTEGHIRMIKRYTENLDLCFDADTAGDTAAERGVGLALAYGMNVGVVMIDEPGVKDPADFVKKHGSKWSAYAQESKPFMEHYMQKFRTTFDLATAKGKKAFSEKILPLVATMKSNIERAHWIGEIATALKVKEEVVQSELALVKVNSPVIKDDELVSTVRAEDAKLDIFEESLLSLIIKKPDLSKKLSKADLEHFSDNFREALALKDKDPNDMRIQMASLKAEEVWSDTNSMALDQEFEKLLNHLKKRKIIAVLENLEYEIKEAEQKGEKDRLEKLVAEFTKTSSQL